MKKNKFYFLITLLCLALLTAMAAGCGTTTSGSADPAGPVVVNLEGGDWGYPTPFTHYQRGPGIYKANLIYDSLLERDEKGLIPWLAKEWDISPNGKVYTFYLQDNVKWHDGQPLTAADVQFSFEYYAQHPPVYSNLNFGGDSLLEKTEAVDDKTVRITISQPDATFLGKAGLVHIIPRHIWENVEDPNKFIGPEAVIGSGPYTLEDYNKEQGAYKFKAFADFWGPGQAVDVIQFIPVSDPVLAFDNEEIDLANITPDILSKYENNPEYKVLQNPAFWGYRLIFNLEKRPELQQLKVRQAIGHAINKAELIEKVARGAAVPASAGYLPQDHIWYNKDIKQYDYNPEKARELLEGKTLQFKLLVGNTQPEIRLAELMKISLSQVGITLEVQSVDMKTRDAAIKNKDYEIVLNGHGGWGHDADRLRTTYASAKAYTQSPDADVIPGYNNDEINQLCQQQLVELNEQKRKEIVFRLQELIAQDLPQLPLYNTTDYVVYRPGKYDGWRYMFNHHEVSHSKISFLKMD